MAIRHGIRVDIFNRSDYAAYIYFTCILMNIFIHHELYIHLYSPHNW